MNGPLDLHPKTAATGLGGSAGLVVIWVLGLAHVTVDPVVAGAIVVTLAGFGAWLAPLLKREATAGK